MKFVISCLALCFAVVAAEFWEDCSDPDLGKLTSFEIDVGCSEPPDDKTPACTWTNGTDVTVTKMTFTPAKTVDGQKISIEFDGGLPFFPRPSNGYDPCSYVSPDCPLNEGTSYDLTNLSFNVGQTAWKYRVYVTLQTSYLDEKNNTQYNDHACAEFMAEVVKEA